MLIVLLPLITKSLLVYMQVKNYKKDAISQYHLNDDAINRVQFEIQSLEYLIQVHREDLAKAHIHSFYQIIWFKSGIGKHFVDFNGYDVSENTIFLLPRTRFMHSMVIKTIRAT